MAGTDVLQANINPMQISSLIAFMNASSRCQGGGKDVYFFRYIGYENEKKYIELILEMDGLLNRRRSGGQGGYCRLSGLEGRLDTASAAKYAEALEKRQIAFEFQNALLQKSLWPAVDQTLALYRRVTTGVSDSMVKNFGIKLLCWLDQYLPGLYGGGQLPDSFPKFAFSGPIKAQEYLFLCLLASLGCDVLYLNPEGDATLSAELLALSSVHMEKNKGALAAPAFDEKRGVNAKPVISAASAAVPAGGASVDPEMVQMDKTRFVRPSRHTKPAPQEAIPESRPRTDRETPAQPARQLEYEELAALSPAIVMISVYDKNKQCFKTGSGVVISESGYILTNFHVACEGAYYGIRFEESEKVYETDELIKYNQVHDLAILRIDHRCRPIRLYGGTKDLVRGQKVVAIGSPLGLFNSVSDGIISGFRSFDAVSMIQFTAPISHGSSGGALLNLYGELIGIITAGFDDGQNLNLAVDYKTVRQFAGGFL